MCAAILTFAIIMSMIINLVERMIIHHNEQEQAKENETEEAFVAKKTD